MQVCGTHSLEMYKIDGSGGAKYAENARWRQRLGGCAPPAPPAVESSAGIIFHREVLGTLSPQQVTLDCLQE